MSYFRRALHYLKPYWRLAIASVLLILLATAVGLLAPWPLQILIDNVLQGKPLPEWMPALGENRQQLLIMVVVAGLLITECGHHSR